MGRKWCSHFTMCKCRCARMRVVSRRILEMSLSCGSVRSVRRDVRLAMVDVLGVPVRVMTMGRMSISIHDQWHRRALARGVYLSKIRNEIKS
jgi:hypothetical protein